MGANKGYLMVLAAALMWGCIGIFVNELSAAGMTSVSIAALRLLAGAVCMVPVLLVRGARGPKGDPLAAFRIDGKSLACCALVGVFGLACANCAYYESMRCVGMSTASVLLYTSPVFGCLLGRVLFRERIVANKVGAVMFNVAGCVFVATEGDLSRLGFNAYGIAVGVVAGLLGALLAVFSKMATERADSLAVTLYGFIFGGVAMGVLAYPWGDIAASASPHALLVLAGFGLIPTALAYILYMGGLALGLEASKVPVVASFETVATVLVGICVYAEPMGPIKAVGICLVLLSIAVMNVDVRALRSSVVVRRLSEAMSFNASAWRAEKACAYSRLLDDADWQAWLAPR